MDGKTYNSEEEFLRDYDSSVFEKLSITTDILILSVADEDTGNYRKLDHKVLSVLLVCINIFMGMNSLNIKDFILKLMFEILICFNIVLFPIIKNWFYKLKSFSN